MRTLHLLTKTALLAGLCLAPLTAVAADAAAGDHPAAPKMAASGEHAKGPKIGYCESDKERDELRAHLQRMGDKERGEFIGKLRDFMEERRQRLDHLCDLIRKHPHLSAERKQELLAIIEERREEIRNRMKEFFENLKDRYEHRVELRKLGEHIDDLRTFLKTHPCLNDNQKERLTAKLADLREERHDNIVEWKSDHPNAGDGQAADSDRPAPGAAHYTGGSAISDEQKQALAARMAAMKKEHVETHQEIKGDVQEIREDRQAVKEDRQELHADYKELKDDKADKNKVDVKSDLQDIHEDRKDLHADQKELHQDKAELRGDLRDAGRPGLTDEQKEKLKAMQAERAGDRPEQPAAGDRPQLTDEQKEKLKAHMDALRERRTGDGTEADGTAADDGGDRPQLTDEQKARLRERVQQVRENRAGPGGPGGPGGSGKPAGERGNNGLGNGEDPQPNDHPRLNDGPGSGPGRPGARAGAGAGK